MTRSSDEFGGDFSADEMDLARTLRERFSWKTGACPSADLLRAAAEHALPEDLQKQVNRHIVECSVCTALQQDLSSLQPAAPDPQQLQRIRQRIPVLKPSVWAGWMRPVPLFATLAILALATWAVRSWSGRNSETTRTVQSQPTQPASTAKIVEIAVAKAPIVIPGNIAMSWRGAVAHDHPSLQEWTSALAPYKNDDFAQASNLLSAITHRYPKFGDGYFYFGVSELLQQKNQSAAQALEAALRFVAPDRRSEAAWYLGAAYARLGQTEEAADRWRQLCDGHSAYSAQACDDLNRLKRAQ